MKNTKMVIVMRKDLKNIKGEKIHTGKVITQGGHSVLGFVWDKIGVQRKWVQDYNSPREHFDIALSKKKLAISFGAKEITMRQLATITANRKDNNSNGK